MKQLLAMAALLTLSQASGGALLSLIEKGGRETSSLNRAVPFVELRDTGPTGRAREYSVPYVAEPMVRGLAADLIANWQTEQDTLHWAMMVGLNNDVTSLGLPHDTRFLNCDLRLPADLTIAAGQALTGTTWIVPRPDLVSLSPSDPTAQSAGALPPGWRDDGLGLPFVDVPRVPRERYCAHSSTELVPDELTTYIPGARLCTPIGCVSTPRYPEPLLIDWAALSLRMQAACDRAAQVEVPEYQKANVESLAKNAPLAIHWNGVAAVQGPRSGTTLAPFFANTSFAASVARLSGQDPRLAPYLLGQLPPSPDALLAAGQPGVPRLETLKRALDPGNLEEQEKGGVASFLQTWQQLDTVLDLRPLRYWAKAMECSLFGGCVPVPVPLPMPAAFVNIAACTVPPAGPRTGSTSLTTWRWRWGVVSVPEGGTVPNVVGSPLLRTDRE